MLKQAQERLVEAGLSEHEAEQYVQPAYDIDRTDFWRHQQNGLAVFIGDNFLRYYRVPLPLEERVVTSHQFHLKPLLPLLTQDTRFYILALSQKQVRLLEATRERAKQIDLTNVAEVPQSLVDLLQYEVPKRQLEHSSTGSAKQAGQLSHHGHGASWRDKKDEIHRFCDRLDSGLKEFFHSDSAPLVLAGVDYLVSIFRSGNPDRLKPEELHERAWSIVSPHLEQARQVAAERYKEIAANQPQHASNDIRDIVRAAYEGCIDTLFAARGYPLWGQFDTGNRMVFLRNEALADDANLSNLALLRTMTHGGKAYITHYEKILDDGTVAAILRY